MSHQSSELPGGILKLVETDDQGRMSQEAYYLGGVACTLVLARYFTDGVQTNESYLSKAKPISRHRYEQLRIVNPNMPPAATHLPDVFSDQLKEARRWSRQDQRKTRATVPLGDSATLAENAKRHDEACLARLTEGRELDPDPNGPVGATRDTCGGKQILCGERTPAASARLLATLRKPY